MLFAVAVSSCKTLQTENAETPEPEIIEVIKYRPGRVVVAPFPQPDSSFVADAPSLTQEHITGPDIAPEAAMATAVAWAGAYHVTKDKYNTLRGWIAGVLAGQNIVQDNLDAANPDAPGAQNDVAEKTAND